MGSTSPIRGPQASARSVIRPEPPRRPQDAVALHLRKPWGVRDPPRAAASHFASASLDEAHDPPQAAASLYTSASLDGVRHPPRAAASLFASAGLDRGRDPPRAAVSIRRQTGSTPSLFTSSMTA